MRKADSLRQWLTAYLPEYKTHPDLLHVWIEGGQVEARRSRSLSFTYRYTLKIGLWEFAGNADHIIVPLLAWIEKEQPQLLRRDDSQPFDFECELLDGDLSDVLISIDLTEAVVVTPNQGGTGYDITHPPEVGLVDSFPGVTASFAMIVANGEEIAP
ncbi:phage tail protein [Sphingobium yanoikuyae]|uniref:phage tail protein n=1 Tax=Sphingobium yanoikuyae TaxID=13690 RepID=UPI0028A81B09|nr:phage tail protein [Sphingobium yanoikuyae]